MPQNPVTGVDNQDGQVQVSAPRGDAPNMVRTVGYAANGEPVILAVGDATSDAEILAEIGGHANYADGSLYLSTATGLLFQKRSDVWTSI